MSNETKLSTFPNNRTEALVMLYLQNKDLNNLSPEELTKLYFETRKEILYAMNNKLTNDKDGYPQINL